MIVVGATVAVAILASAMAVLASGGQPTSRAKLRSVCTDENTSGCPGNAQLEKLSPTRTTEDSTTHTPEEEAAHNKSLETHQRGEEARALAQKKVEEDETRGGEHSIRRVEEKVCYESGKTSEDCKGPLKETPQEERSEAENKARQQQSQEEYTGKPAIVE